MSNPQDGPNPLRPYYIPPSIGQPIPTSSSASSKPGGNSTSAYATSARDLFSDIDYSDYVDGSRSKLDAIRTLLDEGLYKYLSVLLAQPFEVAKIILQVRVQSLGLDDGTIPLSVAEERRNRSSSKRNSLYADYPSDDSDPDEPSYFTSSAPSADSYSPSGSRSRHVTDRAGYVLPSSSSGPASHQLVLKRSDSLLEVISQLWTKEGAWGVWKGSNATFLYSVLLKTVETWSRSALSALINVPDPGMIGGVGLSSEVLDSPYPWLSFGISVAAAAIAGLILAPLDIVRTKLILTSTSKPRRGVYNDLRALPSYSCPPTLFVPTILHSSISPIMTYGTPLFLRSQLGLDPVISPRSFSVATLFSSAAELFVKLPLETVLRRGQMSVLSSPIYLQGNRTLETVVDVGPYKGPIGTMWSIVREEGTSPVLEGVVGADSIRGKKGRKVGVRKGQGVAGLLRGWRVGFWGLVGVWGAAAMTSASGSGGEF